jgi:hypothetical protein
MRDDSFGFRGLKSLANAGGYLGGVACSAKCIGEALRRDVGSRCCVRRAGFEADLDPCGRSGPKAGIVTDLAQASLSVFSAWNSVMTALQIQVG